MVKIIQLRRYQKIAALFLATAVALLALAQLFTFEALPQAFEHLFATTALSGWLIAAALVTAEVFALPFLLGVKTSSLFRTASMILGWVALLMLLIIAVKEIAASQSASLLLGAKIQWYVGIWNVAFIVFLGVIGVGLALLEYKHRK